MLNHDVMEWIADQQSNMVSLLDDLVSIDSNTHDKVGVDRVGARIRAFLEAEGIACETTPVAEHGDALHARLTGGSGNAPVLLMGHMDTVFPTGEVARRPFRVEGNLGYGPGCSDMKAGLVMNAFLLVGFLKTGGPPVPLHALFTGDEEIGSPTSRPIIETAAREARAVFNSEPGRSNGNIVSGRRGGAFYRVRVTGRSAHSGLNPADGRSAIHELARKIGAWQDLGDTQDDISINIGIIAGGQSVNTVAPDAMAEIDLRFTAPDDEAKFEAAITAIAKNCLQDGVTGEVETLGRFRPMAQNDGARALTQLYLDAAHDLGQTTQAEFTRSCADSGVASATGTPTVCATGPIGAKAHSQDEYVKLDTFVPRAQAVALSILKLASEGSA